MLMRSLLHASHLPLPFSCWIVLCLVTQWDVRAPGCPREYESGCPINSVSLHPNQGELVSGDRDGNIRVWDLRQNACSAELVPDGTKAIRSVSVAQDGVLLAAANDHGSVFVWRLGAANDERATKFEPLQKLQVRRVAGGWQPSLASLTCCMSSC